MTRSQHRQNAKEMTRTESERLKRLIVKAGLDPEIDHDQCLSALTNGLDDDTILAAFRSLAAESADSPVVPRSKKVIHSEETYQRFNLSTRLQHGMMAVSILILIVTGLPIKFHENATSQWFMNLIGGIEVSSFVHRLGATGLIFVGLFHLGYISLSRTGRRDFMLLLPRPKDLFDWIKMLKYYFHRTNQKAKFGRFSYIEKFDYWAVYWGMLIMISSGSLLWFQEFSLRFVPKYVLDIATEAHSDEALLATLAIIIWHFYNVHFSPAKFPISKVFIHGKLTREEMEEEHPLELEEILRNKETTLHSGNSGRSKQS